MPTIRESIEISLKPKNILVAADFSLDAGTALAHATAFARSCDSKLFLVHVISPESYPLLHAESIRAAFGRFTGKAERSLKKLSTSRQLQEIPHRLLLESCPTGMLDGLIAQHDISLVILGASTRCAFNRRLLRSAAESVFRTSCCQLLAIGPKVQTPDSANPGFRRVLYPTEHLEQSAWVVLEAMSIAAYHSAHLTILHALHEQSTAALYRLFKPELDREIERFRPHMPNSWCDSETRVECGEPCDTVLRIARADRADLIVIGVTPVDFAAGAFGRSLMHQVVAHAESPVLAIRTEPISKTAPAPSTVATQPSLAQAVC